MEDEILIAFKGNLDKEGDLEQAKTLLKPETEIKEYFDYVGDEFAVDHAGTMYVSTERFQLMKNLIQGK
jgi:hypothetical protein